MLRPWLWLPAPMAYRMMPVALKTWARFREYQTLTWAPRTWRGLEFTNPLGLAGGIDKDAENIEAWWTFGPGFVEVGTVTPRSQDGNPGVTVARDERHLALWNRLGFPSRGLEEMAQRLERLYQPHYTPVFVNLGINRTTPLDEAGRDYAEGLKRLQGLADVFVINVSSPNTQGLRKLQGPEALARLLSELGDVRHKLARSGRLEPLLLKLSPDLSEEELQQILDLSLNAGIDGWILTNSSRDLRDGLNFPEDGGVSGGPLGSRALEFLQRARAHLGQRKQDRLLVSTGGILTPDDAFARLKAGADLVQVYSALVFSGPRFFRSVAEAAELRGSDL